MPRGALCQSTADEGTNHGPNTRQSDPNAHNHYMSTEL